MLTLKLYVLCSSLSVILLYRTVTSWRSSAGDVAWIKNRKRDHFKVTLEIYISHPFIKTIYHTLLRQLQERAKSLAALLGPQCMQSESLNYWKQ